MAKRIAAADSTDRTRVPHRCNKRLAASQPGAVPASCADNAAAPTLTSLHDDARVALRHDRFHRDEIVTRLIAQGPDQLVARFYRRHAAGRRVGRRVDGLYMPAVLSWAEIAARAKREGLVDEGEARLLAGSPPVGSECDDADTEAAESARAGPIRGVDTPQSRRTEFFGLVILGIVLVTPLTAPRQATDGRRPLRQHWRRMK